MFGYNPMNGISTLADYESRAITAENFTGEKGKGGMATEGTGAACAQGLGRGFKVSPSVEIPAHGTFTMADIQGPGEIRHIWLTPSGNFRYAILRIYWDDSEVPSVECPLGDFFACTQIPAVGVTQFHPVSSLAVCVNPRYGMNCYWSMPFRRRCRMTVENLGDEVCLFYYQVDYVLGQVSEDMAYFHAQFHTVRRQPEKQDFVVAEGISGRGQYVGTYMLWGPKSSGWWGEGEMKFYIDGDVEFPTVCGTGTEDYFGGAYNFDDGGYRDYNTPYAGLAVIRTDGLYQSQLRFSMYRWHITDPVYFKQDLRVTVGALGWRAGRRYLPLQDEISSVAFWYQDRPAAWMPGLPCRDDLEIV